MADLKKAAEPELPIADLKKAAEPELPIADLKKAAEPDGSFSSLSLLQDSVARAGLAGALIARDSASKAGLAGALFSLLPLGCAAFLTPAPHPPPSR